MKKIWFSNDSLAQLLADNGIDLICDENMNITLSDEDAEKVIALIGEKAPAASDDYGIEELTEDEYKVHPVYSVGCSTDEWDQTLATGMTFNDALDFFEQLSDDVNDERYRDMSDHCTGGCFWIKNDLSNDFVKEFYVGPKNEA